MRFFFFLSRDGLREVYVEWGDISLVHIPTKRLNTELVVRVFYYVAINAVFTSVYPKRRSRLSFYTDICIYIS